MIRSNPDNHICVVHVDLANHQLYQLINIMITLCFLAGVFQKNRLGFVVLPLKWQLTSFTAGEEQVAWTSGPSAASQHQARCPASNHGLLWRGYLSEGPCSSPPNHSGCHPVFHRCLPQVVDGFKNMFDFLLTTWIWRRWFYFPHNSFTLWLGFCFFLQITYDIKQIQE